MYKIAKRFYADTIDILGGAKIKVKSISLKIELIGLVTIALSIAGGKMALARISKSGGGDFCKLCHTCGGDGAGGGHKPLKSEYQGPEGCVNCHSSSESSTTYELSQGGETVTVPVVNYTGDEAPTEYLAGGNFYWVAQDTQATDPLGHNVLDIALQDRNLTEAPGNVTNCYNSCHKSLVVNSENKGCQGCHLRPAHHADDSNVVVGLEDGDDDGFYRFLSGHYSGMTPEGLIIGVAGIEDSDWQATSDATDHNEYLGFSSGTNFHADKRYATSFGSVGHTMTAFCCGCHGNYHIQNEDRYGRGRWKRHPSDWEIPDSGEYANAFGANGTGAGTYDPDVPVARPSSPYFGWTGPESTVVFVRGTGAQGGNVIGDMVMCISCHRPHGSPYPKMLRWDPNDTGASCATCHTEKPPSGTEYHHVAECSVCHDMHGETSNLKLIRDQIDGPQGLEDVVFTTDPPASADYANEGGARICEVCHPATMKYYTTFGGTSNHHLGEDCMSCHSHCDEFRHGAAPGPGCDQAGCHGHDGGAGTVQSHSTHTENDADDQKGPHTPMTCDTCHDINLFPYFASGTDDNDDGHIDLSETDVCDPCHSAGGAFDGLQMVKAEGAWAAGIYETDGTLQTGKEYWCASCHDADQAIIDGQTAPNIAGDNTTFGFYVTGHGTTGPYRATPHGQNGPGYACTVCHDTTLTHISGTLDDPRLNAVTGDALDYTSDVSEVCLDCHLVGQSGNGSLGYDATAEASVHSGGVNEKYNTSATAPTAFPAYGDSADYATNPGYQCEDCHDLHGSQKLAMVLGTIDCNVGGTSNPVSVAGFESTDTDLTDLDPSATADNGVCDVCHASGGDPHPDANHPGNHHQGDTGDSCMVCHSHTASFAHGGGTGEGCEPCHGHDAGYEYSPGEFSQGAGTVQSHSTHTENDSDDLKGPNIACGDCHDTINYPYFKSGTGDPPYDLSNTDVCDTCHSPGGAFDGVGKTGPDTHPDYPNWVAYGAKFNWRDGIYTGDATALRDGKEGWCASCHDDVPSVIEGVSAPKVMGDDVMYGYNISGHGRNPVNYVNCSDCHDLTMMHTDAMARTYESLLDNYKDGYRLKYSMDIPRKTDDYGPEVFELCFQCHTYEDIFDDTPPFNTNFRDDENENYHGFHLYQYWFDYWDSDWDGVLDSSGSCTACHNVHGSPTVVMTRHGELISTPGTDPPDKVPALDFRWYKSDGETPTDILEESRYGSLICGLPQDVSTNNICWGCHPTESLTYYRDPGIAPIEEMEVKKVWTTDLSNNKKTDFAPGEDIRYHVRFTITGPGSYFVRAIGKAFNISGQDWVTKFTRKKETVSEGTYHWRWSKTVPSNATPNSDAKVRITVKMFDAPDGNLLDSDKKTKKFYIVAP